MTVNADLYGLLFIEFYHEMLEEIQVHIFL